MLPSYNDLFFASLTWDKLRLGSPYCSLPKDVSQLGADFRCPCSSDFDQKWMSHRRNWAGASGFEVSVCKQKIWKLVSPYTAKHGHGGSTFSEYVCPVPCRKANLRAHRSICACLSGKYYPSYMISASIPPSYSSSRVHAHRLLGEKNGH
jgi:hypothetical protein